MRWHDYPRAWAVLKVGLVAAPLAPLVAPLVGARLAESRAMTARLATVVAVALMGTFLVRALRRSRREALLLLASEAGAASIAARLVAARDNSLFIADLLYEASAMLLVLATISAGLRRARPEQDDVAGARWFFARRAVGDTVTRQSAWVLVIFWICVAAGLRYVSAGVLFLLAGTITATLLLRLTELAARPRPRKAQSLRRRAWAGPRNQRAPVRHPPT